MGPESYKYDKSFATTLEDHEKRIRMLENTEIKSEQQFITIFNWLKRIENGVASTNKLIIGGMGTLMAMLLAFFFWYVQTGGG